MAAAVGVVSAGLVVMAAPAAAVDESADAASTPTQIAVLAVTLVALGAAVIAGRRALRAPVEAGPVLLDDLLQDELLAPRRRSEREPMLVGLLGAVLIVVLLLYAAFDRGFAWFHVPGTPLFVGEAVLTLGALAMVSSPVPMAKAVRESPALKALLAWMAWGFLFFILQVPFYGIDAVRDSALWYYGAVAVLVVFLLLSDPSRFGRWADVFGRVLPFLLLWFPIAIALDSLFGRRAPYVPDSVVPLFAHRFGNIAVLSGVAIGFVWLVDRERGRFTTSQRIALTALAAVNILLAGFQNRGGMVAATIGILLMLVFLRKRRGELVLVLAGVAVLLSTVAIVSEVRIPVSNGREISATQMVNNISSVIDPDSGGTRQTGTTQWRLDLWSRVVDDVTAERPLTGFGPGPNLGKRYGVETSKTVPLRNPHNSHIGVIARMGWIGGGMWVILWLVWTFQLFQLRSRLRQHGRTVEAGLIAWLFVSTVMILINAFFDPTLEGPMVAFWLWSLFGIGAAIPLFYAGLSSAERRRSVAHTSGGSATDDTSVAERLDPR
jgi:cell division protein FtsW (lipid II flippase)